MIFGKTKLEIKVGIFVFIGMVILIIFVLMIGDFKTVGSSYRLNFIYNFGNGLKLGAPIRFQGVDVGEVKVIDVFFSSEENKSKVKISGWINNKARVPVDSKVWINTLGLLGEKYIEIIPGSDYSNLVGADGTIIGIDPIPMHEVTQIARDIASEVNTTIKDIDAVINNVKEGRGTLGKLLYEDTIYGELEAFVKDIRKHPWKLFFKTKEKPEKK